MLIPIVEGPGDRDALPILIRRILGERLGRYDIPVLRPKNANGKPTLLKSFEQFVRYALITEGCKGILVLIDADTDCPKELAIYLARRTAALQPRVPIAIVCAKHEYETWFISSLSSSTGQMIKENLGLSRAVTSPDCVEDIRGAKAWLTDRMPSDRAYKETSDQANLTPHIEMDVVYRKSRSFRRLCHAIEELVQALDNNVALITPRYVSENT